MRQTQRPGAAPFSTPPIGVVSEVIDPAGESKTRSGGTGILPIARKLLHPLSDTSSSGAPCLPYQYHEGMTLILVTGGTAVAVVQGEPITLSAGDLLAAAPFEAHGLFLKGTSPVGTVRLTWHPRGIFPPERESDGFFSELRELRFSRLISHGADGNHEIRSAVERIGEALLSPQAGSSVSAYADLMSIYATVSRLRLYRENTPENGYIREFMSRVSDYLEDHADEDISTSDIAAHCQYTTEHFCRLFKKCFDKTFKDYLNIYRIHRAKAFIDEGNYETLAEISSKCGFNNQNHFSHMFKKYVGTLPSEYGKREKKEE